MKIQESAENYLETILVLSKRKSDVHSIDIVNELGFSKPSISRAVNLLKVNGYIDICNNGLIFLTEKGKNIAEQTYERHLLIKSFLIKLGVDEETAVNDACRIEHVISPESFNKIKMHFENMK
ncbi:MAG: DtxR family transcriptional regulator [Clostridiales bacterium GWF2_38_85]|nr:MAG: DtxR family transcriptional regulator [Clostridiales bacterium GWF2_38_85]